jgi:hypothetical protein
VAQGDQADVQGAGTDRRRPTVGPAPRTVRLQGLVLVDTASTEPVAVEALLFADDGIGVIANRGERPRVLPWASLTAHAIERWGGGEIPGHWMAADDEGSHPDLWAGPAVAPAPPPLRPRVEAGALIGIQTPYGTYRFLHPGSDPTDLSRRVSAFAVRHQGPGAASSVTRVVTWGQDVERRQRERLPAKPAGWARTQPYLVVLLVVVLAVVVTLILLQSAGVIHLPLLGGSGSSPSSSAGPIGTIRTR